MRTKKKTRKHKKLVTEKQTELENITKKNLMKIERINEIKRLEKNAIE